MLDTEIEGEGLQGQIEALKLDITNMEKEIIQDEKKWKKLYDSQGGKPMVVVAKAKSSTPLNLGNLGQVGENQNKKKEIQI
jgi:hypothetical protein